MLSSSSHSPSSIGRLSAAVRHRIAACCGLLLAATLPFQADASAPGVVAAAQYVDASAYIQGEDQINAWYGMTWQLKRDFDYICGDTFCEGDFTNIEALRYSCSVHQVSGRIGMCVWVFAGSNEEVDPTTGKILVQRKFWRCRTSLAPRTTLEELLVAVDGQSPLYAPLPGGRASIYDGLVDCL